jgi:hypothetical protein
VSDDRTARAGSAGRARSAERHKAYARFRDAVHNLAGEPTPTNVVRYLAASRALEEARRGARAAA